MTLFFSGNRQKLENEVSKFAKEAVYCDKAKPSVRVGWKATGLSKEQLPR